MTIQKGAQWGTPGVVPAGAIRAGSDQQLAGSASTVVLTGGNIHLALGSPPARATGEPCMILPLDALEVVVTMPDGTRESTIASGEVQVGSWLARAGMTVITNGGLLGPLNIAPRAHPNDGHLDVFRVASGMGLRARLAARRRARTGTHLPHPDLRVSTCTEVDLARAGSQALFIDGRKVSSWTRVSVRVLPDRLSVAV